MADVGKETWPHKILHQSPLGNQGGQLAKIGSPANCQLKWCVSEHTWSKADTEYALNCNLAQHRPIKSQSFQLITRLKMHSMNTTVTDGQTDGIAVASTALAM